MRVLFTNSTLAGLAGSELYIYDLAIELRRRGHEVTCFTLEPGLVAERLRERGVCVESDLRALPEVDVIHAHHQLETRLVAARFPDTPLVFVSHGILPGPERPGSSISLFAAGVIAVSEDVRATLIDVDGVPPEIISVVPNFVDTERFRSRRQIADRPERVLVISNHWGDGGTREVIEKACRIAGRLELRVVGAATKSVWEVEEYIEWADVVITLGRGALQAMAMSRSTVIFDYRGGDGRVTPWNFDRLADHNFSGRAHNRQYTADELANEIVGYERSEVAAVTDRVRTERSVSVMAERLLAYYAGARERATVVWTPAARAAKLESMLRNLAEQTAIDLMAERDLLRLVSQGRVMRAMNAAQRVADAAARFPSRLRRLAG